MRSSLGRSKRSSRVMLAGLVALALAVNGPAATGLALVDEPTPSPSLSDQGTPSTAATDVASPAASGSATDEASGSPTDGASDSASPSQEAAPAGTPSETAAAEDVDGATGSPSATATEDTADLGDAALEPVAGPDARRAIAPFAAGDATIRVRKGDRRLGNASDQPASGLAGAVFEAYANGNDKTQNYSGTPVATCTTDANGTCDLKVDSSQGPRYVVVEKSAPAGWRKIDQIALGGAFDSGIVRDYRWNVAVSAGDTTVVPQTAIINSGTQTWPNRRSSPTNPPYQWADARDNVPLPPAKCGLNVAMLFDLSGSIGSNLPLVKAAGSQFVDDLTGTPTSIALFTFSTNSPQNGGNSQNRPALVSIADPGGATQVKGWINGFSAASGGTNWDAGLRRVANATQQYDVVVVITDGNPTAWEGDTSTTSDINDYDVENAIHSANWVKSEGTRIVSIGVSSQSGGLSPVNLQTISGTALNDDYYLTTFGDLADVLTSIALNGCGGTISVQKRIAPTWPVAETRPAEPDWPFSVDPAQDYVSPRAGTTGPNGEPVTFKVAFEQGQLARDVTISEPPNHKGTVLVQDAAKNARCFNKGQPLPANRLLNEGGFGFTVKDVVDKDIISCVVVDSDAQLQAVKYNDTNGNGVRDTGELGLPTWTLFLDDNSNSALDTRERSVSTNQQGQALFDRLEAPKEYRVCEVQQSGWFNTDPGGGVVCKTQQVNLGDAPAGPVEFGNVQAGSFTITKDVVDTGGFVSDDLEFTINVACTFNNAPVTGYPKTYTLGDGESATVGPLFNGTSCTVTEPGANGAVVSGVPRTVSIPTDDGVTVTVTNTYPVGHGEVVKVVDGPLAGELAPPGTEFEVDVTCTFPDGHPSGPGPVPGYDPKVLTIASGDTVGQPGPPTQFGPLPVGTTCTAAETDDNGADPSSVAPGSVTIAEGGPTEQTRFTASNTYNPAAVKVLKKVEPAGIVPDDTEFTARVDCWFPTNPTPGQGQPDRSETVTFSVDQWGIVSNLPLNSQCQVTETDTNGASAVVDPGGLFPVDEDPVEVTITNTFPVGQLTVEKVVNDPSGLVAVGTQYTINVACTFDGQDLIGYPQDVVLTYDTDLSKTLTDLPFGTTCTITEPDLEGADSVTFRPPAEGGTSAVVTIGPDPNDGVSVTVTATNDYPAGTFPIEKSVIGPGAGFVPAATEFEVTVTCTLPPDFPGTDPAPYVVTIEGGQTVIVPTAPDKPLPVGTTCTVDETGIQGAGSSVVLPDEVTIENEGAQNVEVVVTNTYPAGSFTVAKLVSGEGSRFVPAGTEFDVEVTCTFPPGFPVTGQIPGFGLPDPLVVTITTGSRLGVPGLPVPVGPLPVGSECTLSEPDLNGASSVTFTPTDTVVVPGGQDPPVNVVVENTYPAGFGEIVKVATGPLASQLAPEGTVFLVELRCAFPADFPGQDPAGQNPDPIPGYNPRELAIASGQPGQPGEPAKFGPLPVGSTCSIIETQSGGADPVEISPPGGSPVGSITILDPAQDPDPVQVTVTNTFNPAALRITKVVTGPGAPLLPTDTVFTAQVTCTFQGQTTFDSEVEFSVDNPGEVTNQPIGASCLITETQTNGATAVNISPNPVLLVGPSPVLVDATVTNTMPAGQLTVLKVIAGDAANEVPDGVSFTVGVNCSFQGNPLPGYPQKLTFTTPSPLSETLTGLPVGAQCFVNESDDGGATSVEFVPPAGPNDPAGQSGIVTITENAQDPVSVTVANIFEPAVLRIFKNVQPEGLLLPPGLRFTAQVDCAFEGESIYSGEVEFGVSSPGVVSGLIVGAECTVAETASFGASFDPPSQTVIIAGTGDPVTVDVTITNTFQTGSLSVQKVIDDGGTGLVPTNTPYQIAVTCRFTGADLPGYPTTVTVTPSGGPVPLPGLLPVGTICDLSEPDLNGASSVTFTPGSSVEITEDTPDVAVTATNVYPVGTLEVTKVVDGPGAPSVPAGTQFTVEVSCTYPDDFPGAGTPPGTVPGFDPLTLTLTSGQTEQVGPLPVGAVCDLSETGQSGAGSVVLDPSRVTITGGEVPVKVTVTNTYPVGGLTITKVVTGTDASSAVGPFQFSITCTFLGSPLKPQPANVVITPPALSATVNGLPVGAECAVAELPPYGGADGPGVITPSKVVIGSGQPVKVVATNTFTKPPVPPAPTPETCDPNTPGAQLPGSITIPANPEFAYAINGVAYAAGTYPFPVGSYQVTAARTPGKPVASAGAGLRQLATQDAYAWTVVVPGSPVCPLLDKSADPPSGDTVLTGDVVTYTITVQNGGDTAVVGETLVDTLPDGVELIKSSITPSTGVYNEAAGTITWQFDLPPASGTTPSSAAFGYQVTVTADEGSISNSVSWVERKLTDSTEHPVEPEDQPPIDQPTTGGLTDTGAGDADAIASAGLIAMLLGGLMVGFGRRRRHG